MTSVYTSLIAFIAAASLLTLTPGLRWIGAAYLVWVGYRMLRYPRQGLLSAAECLWPSE